MDWKNYLLINKWLPSSYLIEKFGIHKYDLDNFKRKERVKQVLEPWKISQFQERINLIQIFKKAWDFYLHKELGIDFSGDRNTWVPKLLKLKNISRKSHFEFLVNSKYFKLMYYQDFIDYKDHGFTNVAFALNHFYPGKRFLKENGVLPFMFFQTHKKATEKITVDSMLEHIYFNFLSDSTETDLEGKMEIFYARFDEPNFISRLSLQKFGLPAHFLTHNETQKSVLTRIAKKYAESLGYETMENNSNWSTPIFKKKYGLSEYSKCAYCGLQPVDLHHLLPRSIHPNLVYHVENVIPVCVQVHSFISRNQLSLQLKADYDEATKNWLSSKNGDKKYFDEVMIKIHDFIYGVNFIPMIN